MLLLPEGVVHAGLCLLAEAGERMVQGGKLSPRELQSMSVEVVFPELGNARQREEETVEPVIRAPMAFVEMYGDPLGRKEHALAAVGSTSTAFTTRPAHSASSSDQERAVADRFGGVGDTGISSGGTFAHRNA